MHIEKRGWLIFCETKKRMLKKTDQEYDTSPF